MKLFSLIGLWILYGYSDALSCYQCRSFGRQNNSLCEFPDQWSDQQRRIFTVACPKSNSAFCFKQFQLQETPARVRRGCLGEKSSDGYVLRTGCVETIDHCDARFVTCFCSTNQCNRGTITTRYTSNVLSLCLVVLLCVLEVYLEMY